MTALLTLWRVRRCQSCGGWTYHPNPCRTCHPQQLEETP